MPYPARIEVWPFFEGVPDQPETRREILPPMRNQLPRTIGVAFSKAAAHRASREKNPGRRVRIKLRAFRESRVETDLIVQIVDRRQKRLPAQPQVQCEVGSHLDVVRDKQARLGAAQLAFHESVLPERGRQSQQK